MLNCVSERDPSGRLRFHREWRIYEEIGIMLSFSLGNDYMRGTAHFEKKKRKKIVIKPKNQKPD